MPMSMKVSFELSAKDLRYFRSRLENARKGRASRDEAEIVRHAMELVVEAVESEPPEFVLTRLEQLRRLTEMLGDLDWNLVGRDRARILDALTYFIEPNDLIPDRTPGIGYLDDAIIKAEMIAGLTPGLATVLVLREVTSIFDDLLVGPTARLRSRLGNAEGIRSMVNDLATPRFRDRRRGDEASLPARRD